ncbi:transcriptional regulator MraZ [Spirochaetia bacterium]|nr:transcriptional regulator MraZ [Spirochaetia bacterium]GHV89425.1 transcriptional regulator MraZ [Spirochaetia bacterium]
MNLLTGEFKNTLDDKGRVSIPARLREKLSGNILWLTKGYNNKNVWLLSPEHWEKVSDNIMKDTSILTNDRSHIIRRIIGAAQEGEIDNAGRIAIPQSLRDFAGLSRECVILGTGKDIEIWDAERYQMYLEANEEGLMDKLGSIDLFS